MEREMCFTGLHAKYDHQRYLDATRRLRELVLHDTIRAQVAVMFGSGTELTLLSAVQDGLRAVANALWISTQEKWPETKKWILERMTAVDGGRKTLEQRLIKVAQPPWWLAWTDRIG
jgi:hypothetical protein